jgi:UDP-N-acetylglucosamine 2-epimerase
VEVLVVGEDAGPHEVVAALDAHEVRVRRAPEAALPGADGDEIGQLADALLAFDRLFGEEPPEAVLLISASNLALAALLVATKARIPVVGVDEERPGEGFAPSMNGRLIAQLADAVVAPDAATIAASLRNLAAA